MSLSEHPAVALVQMRARRGGQVSPWLSAVALATVVVASAFGMDLLYGAQGLPQRALAASVLPWGAVLSFGIPFWVAGRLVAHMRCLRSPGVLEDLLPTQVPPSDFVDPLVRQAALDTARLWTAVGPALLFVSVATTLQADAFAPLVVLGLNSVGLAVPLGYSFLALAGWGAGVPWTVRLLLVLSILAPATVLFGVSLMSFVGTDCVAVRVPPDAGFLAFVLGGLWLALSSRQVASWTLRTSLAPRTRAATARPLPGRAPENPVLYRQTRLQARRPGRYLSRYGLGVAVVAASLVFEQVPAVVFLVPLLLASPYRGLLRSMESMAEERERGTFEVFLTSGVTVREFVLAWTVLVLGPLLAELLLAGSLLAMLSPAPGQVLAGAAMVASLTTCTTFMGMLSARRPENASAAWRHREAMVVCAPMVVFGGLALAEAPLALLGAASALALAAGFLQQAWLALSRRQDTVSFRA